MVNTCTKKQKIYTFKIYKHTKLIITDNIYFVGVEDDVGSNCNNDSVEILQLEIVLS